MANRRVPTRETLIPPATMQLPVPARLRSKLESLAGAVPEIIIGALGEVLPTTARALQDLETRLMREVARAVVAPAIREVLLAVHRDERFVLACLDQARLERGITPHSKKKVTVRLLSGETIELTTTYATIVRERRPGRRRGVGRHGPDGRGSYPVLAQLGVVERASPALESEVAWSSAALGSFAEAQEALAHRGVDLHVNAVRLLTNRFADAGLLDREIDAPAAPGEGPLAGKRVVIAIDGGRLRIRVEKRGRKRKETGHHGYETPWREPKMLAVYTIDERGKKDHAFTFYEATLVPYDEAFALFVRRLRRLGISDAREVIFAADGSEHVWSRVPAAVAALGLTPERLRTVVDFWHAVEHAYAAAKLLPRKTEYEASLCGPRWKRALREGRSADVVDEIAAAARLARGEAKTLLENHAAYFRDNAERMRYHELRSRGLPIGSGVVESAIRRVVNLRVKGPGIFWDEENAERMLLLRSRLKAGRWRDLEDIVHAHAGGLHGGALRAARERERDAA